MRLKAGRPDLGCYAGLFTVPGATAESALSMTWLGVSTVLIDDGETAVMTDGFFSRPALRRVVLGTIAPSAARVDGCLARAGVRRLAAVLPVHSHFDHVMDAPLVAARTGALLVGGESTANVGRGHGLPEDRIVVATPGEPIRLGPFEVTLVQSHHCPPDRYPGVITAPVHPPVRVTAYRCGEAWSTLIRHLPTGRSCLIQGSAGFLPGALTGHRAEVVYLGLGQLGLQPASYLRQYWAETVRAVGARTVVGVHWDDFFRPLSQPLRALPYAGDDLDFTLQMLGELAEEDPRNPIRLQLPTLWRREDPWA